ncbi:MAG: hypothetical protein ACLGGV_07395 [Bacteroidia bacterium]
MIKPSEHTFHIPVMGLGFTIDTPIKVAKYGISSVVSIIQDDLVEQMREFYSNLYNEQYEQISKDDIDHRAKRISAYLNLLQRIVVEQIEKIKQEPFEEGNDVVKYFQLLPDSSTSKQLYLRMLTSNGEEKNFLMDELRKSIVAGDIDVNIMTKIDNSNTSKTGEPLPTEYNDAVAAFRGFANSNLSSSIVFSAGLNPHLFSFIEHFSDFFPDKNGNIKKKIILKVSDYRSAIIQGKMLAKRGIWVSEFRIESGLNCGGHAFPTKGFLLGPTLEEFKEKRNELNTELLELCNKALIEKNLNPLSHLTSVKITAQGGIGTHQEDEFLREYYGLDTTGWGSPFLLVPEATAVDADTLKKLTEAKKEDYYLSHASPLGVPFNTFKNSSSEKQRIDRINHQRPGSPCYKKFLAFNTEFTDKQICVSSREYQHKKINALKDEHLDPDVLAKRINEVIEKDCLCEGLSSSILLKNNLPIAHNLDAVVICPGPNLAYFSSVYSLEEMIGHIYGRFDALNTLPRPHMFINELAMYIDYYKKELDGSDNVKDNYATAFKENLFLGIEYYKQLISSIDTESLKRKNEMQNELTFLENELIKYTSAAAL